MAFEHNGNKYSNKDAYNTAKATQSPKSPSPDGAMASTPDQPAPDPSQGAQGAQDPNQAVAAMQQAMQELQAGQQPSPQVAQAIVEFFSQFAGGEPDGDESGDPMSGFDQA